MSDITQWFQMNLADKPKIIGFLKGHPKYRFIQDAGNENVLRNSIPGMYGVAPGDVMFEIRHSESEENASQILLQVTYREGAYDEALSGVIKLNFKVYQSSDD